MGAIEATAATARGAQSACHPGRPETEKATDRAMKAAQSRYRAITWTPDDG
jgi:hypothetical protein